MDIKLTKKREIILDYIQEQKRPISTKKIVENFIKKMDRVTVYRILQYLENIDRIESFIYDCSKTGALKYYYAKNENHYHFLHCNKCHNFEPIKECNNKWIKNLANKNKIKIEKHVLYFTGICPECLN